MSADTLSKPAGTAIDRGQVLTLAADGRFYPAGSSAIPDDGHLLGEVAIALQSVAKGEFVTGELLGGRQVRRALVRAEGYAVTPGTALAIRNDAAALGLAGVWTPVGAGFASGAYNGFAIAAESLVLGRTQTIDVLA